jgi:hypothetical protein
LEEDEEDGGAKSGISFKRVERERSERIRARLEFFFALTTVGKVGRRRTVAGLRMYYLYTQIKR